MLVSPSIECNYVPRPSKGLWPDSLVVQRQAGQPRWRSTSDAIRVKDADQVVRERGLASTPGRINVNDEAVSEGAPSSRPNQATSDPSAESGAGAGDEPTPHVRWFRAPGLRVSDIPRTTKSCRENECKITPPQKVVVRLRSVADEEHIRGSVGTERLVQRLGQQIEISAAVRQPASDKSGSVSGGHLEDGQSEAFGRRRPIVRMGSPEEIQRRLEVRVDLHVCHIDAQ